MFLNFNFVVFENFFVKNFGHPIIFTIFFIWDYFYLMLRPIQIMSNNTNETRRDLVEMYFGEASSSHPFSLSPPHHHQHHHPDRLESIRPEVCAVLDL